MNRKLLRLLPFFTILPFFAQNLQAQSPDCQYTLIMKDANGDGWEGGILTVTSGTQSTPFTLTSGLTDTVTFGVFDGQPLIFTWVQGGSLFEVSYTILDNIGALVSQAVAPLMPGSGVLFTGIGNCVTCSAPLNFIVENQWDTYAKLKWSANPASPNPAVQWRVIYGPQGFDPAAGAGDTATTAIPKITLNQLQKKTWYDAYIEQDCAAAGGWSDRIGPVSFQTYWTKDVGIVGIASPVSGCNLGEADSVRVLIKNYGALPQSLIPFRYSVNGVEAGIPKPDDGVYTGVLGKDSITAFTFETTHDFSAPGEYKIVAYTKFLNDQDLSNDTFTYYINNRLLSPYLQPFEEWDGGWTVTSTAGVPSFEYGAPNKPSIPAAASGQYAWVTHLTGTYNAGERSYLESPCFDFTSLNVDPAITFSINYDLETRYDSAWLEVSVDGGDTWQKVGGIDEGLNWYNLDQNQAVPQLGEAWSGSSGGWVTARHFLTGAAGESEVHCRFAFASDVSVQYGGLGIDDIHIFPAFNKDLGGKAADVASAGDLCGQADDEISFTFVNLGAQPQGGFEVAYSVNGGTPVIEPFGTTVMSDHVATHTFQTTFDSRDIVSVIKCWTILPGEFSTANDTATITIDHRPLPAPFHEDFESQTVPQDWTTDGVVTNAYGNSSYVLVVNLYSGHPQSIHTLPRYGLIGAGDSLEFDYRITDYSGGGATTLALGTKFELQVSTDCGATYQTLNTINSLNHTVSSNLQTRKVSLSQYAGQSLNIRIRSTWTSGDFWFAVDNINLLSCAADMALTADITHVIPGQSNGSATVNVGLGNPPYTYVWSNGATSQTAGNLAIGTYTVTVSDAHGCSDSFEISIGTSATAEIGGLTSMGLYPNPTTGQTTFVASFDRVVGDARLQVVNLLGQPVWETKAFNTTRLSEKMDLSLLPDGLYLVQLLVDGQVATRKLMKQGR